MSDKSSAVQSISSAIEAGGEYEKKVGAKASPEEKTAFSKGKTERSKIEAVAAIMALISLKRINLGVGTFISFVTEKT